ncbi:MAG: hypothetical protein AB7T63_02910 [Planctomycetota bacterium]
MTRRNNDLLSIFDANAQAERKARAQTARAAAARGAAPRASGGRGAGGFTGLWLSPRHVVVASCVVTLLLVLSFFVGLAAGRPGTGPAPALQRNTATTPAGGVILKLTVAAVDITTGRPVRAGDVRQALARYGLDERNVRGVSLEDGQWVVRAGPFPSERAVDAWIEAQRLSGAEVCGSTPFHRRSFEPSR